MMNTLRCFPGLQRVLVVITLLAALFGFQQQVSANDDARFAEAHAAFDEAKNTRDPNHEAFKRAFDIWNELKSAGDKRANYHVGMMYMFGLGGVEMNQQMGVQNVRIAANADYPVAQSFMGFLIESGDGTFVVMGDQHAFSWWEKGAMGNHCAGVRRMIKAYTNGELGVSVDADKSAQWKAKLGTCSKR